MMLRWLGAINWEKVNEITTAFARPYVMYAGGTATALACLNKETAPVALPSMAAILSAYVGGRTIEKVTNIKVTAQGKDDQ
jgi:hypothetical protein